MKEADYYKLTARIAMLKEIATEYSGKTIDNIIQQMENLRECASNKGSMICGNDDSVIHTTIAFIKPTPNRLIPLMMCGTHNGYVAISKGCQYFGEPYDDIDVDVHGGLTLGKYAHEIDEHWFEDVEILTPNYNGIPGSWYIVGFDTCHGGDNPCVWDRDSVIKETLDLQKQLEK